MSLLTNMVVTPNRVLGVYRYLLRADERRERRDTLRRALMPSSVTDESTSRPRNIVDDTLTEGERLGLWTGGETVALAADLPEEAVQADPPSGVLRRLVAERVWAEAQQNDDLGYAVAWLLAQDPLGQGWTAERAATALKDTEWGEKTGITEKSRFATFRNWTCYLGFGWKINEGAAAVLTPDPTAHVRRQLPRLLDEAGQEIAFPVFMEQLAECSPVFEGGRFRSAVEARLSDRPETHLSASTGLALQRLQEEGAVHLVEKADAPAHMVLKDGDLNREISHLRLA